MEKQKEGLKIMRARKAEEINQLQKVEQVQDEAKEIVKKLKSVVTKMTNKLFSVSRDVYCLQSELVH